jgi:hypothetical protein
MLSIWRRCGQQDDVAFPLVGAFCMIMRFVLREGMAQGVFTQQDEPREHLILDGSHPLFRLGIQA